jgi:hypothetical protein
MGGYLIVASIFTGHKSSQHPTQPAEDSYDERQTMASEACP